MNKRNIVLIGFMGSGKSSIGRDLAYLLKMDFYDSDNVIEHQQQKTIPYIFMNLGEEYFRAEEVKTIKELSEKKNVVIATGGGVITDQRNIQALRSNGVLIYLRADCDHIYNNVKDDHNRPLLQTDQPYETMKALLNSRHQAYEKASDIQVDVSGKSIPEIIACIQEELGLTKEVIS
ncbi:shikimate kinase [Vallitalea okinawensis]|uniref:shikimate kinase n=1 Tax=Vallitalea okinawensis TaxID=2078660 RepID=UPI000CFE2580|nr:shikimate kinase [Vallitalea okinawensis]